MPKTVKPLVASVVALAALGAYQLGVVQDPWSRLEPGTCAPGQHCAPLPASAGGAMEALPAPGSRVGTRPSIDQQKIQRWETATFGLG